MLTVQSIRKGVIESRRRLSIPIVVFALLGFANSAAMAQLPVSPPGFDNIPVLPPTAVARIGEEVIDQNGVLVSRAYFLENKICNRNGCRRFVTDRRSGALIINNGMLTPAYGKTDRGEQVIRVLAFNFSEYPQPEPSDAALDTAPSIISVRRYTPAEGQ